MPEEQPDVMFGPFGRIIITGWDWFEIHSFGVITKDRVVMKIIRMEPIQPKMSREELESMLWEQLSGGLP